MKSDFRSESFKENSVQLSFSKINDWMLEENIENYPIEAFEQRNKETQTEI